MAVAELVGHLLKLGQRVVVLVQCHQVSRSAGCPLQSTVTIQEELNRPEISTIDTKSNNGEELTSQNSGCTTVESTTRPTGTFCSGGLAFGSI
jgi:hypothetical protein